MQNKDWVKFAREVFSLQNKVRTNPRSFIHVLERRLACFRGNQLYSDDKKSFVQTKEGPFGYVEAIEFLRTRKAAKPLKWSEELAMAARDHVNDIGEKGLVQTLGTDGSTPTERIDRYGKIDEAWAESNIFGAASAQEVVERLIVCDGQPTRGFRKSLFNEDLKLCGIATGPHATHDNMIQFEYVKNLLKDGEQPTINVELHEEVDEGVLQQIERLGIDKSKISIIKDPRSTNKKVMSLLEYNRSSVPAKPRKPVRPQNPPKPLPQAQPKECWKEQQKRKQSPAQSALYLTPKKPSFQPRPKSASHVSSRKALMNLQRKYNVEPKPAEGGHSRLTETPSSTTKEPLDRKLKNGPSNRRSVPNHIEDASAFKEKKRSYFGGDSRPISRAQKPNDTT